MSDWRPVMAELGNYKSLFEHNNKSMFKQKDNHQRKRQFIMPESLSAILEDIELPQAVKINVGPIRVWSLLCCIFKNIWHV